MLDYHHNDDIINNNDHRLRCPYCGAAVVVDDNVVVCEKCGNRFHPGVLPKGDKREIDPRNIC